MNILFLTTGTNALGETFTAAIFAQQLFVAGHKCFFIAPKLGASYLKTFGFEPDSILVLPTQKDIPENFSIFNNRPILDEFVNRISPDFIISADWHHFKPNGVSTNDTYSIYWFDERIKMGTFDHLGFAPGGVEIELYDELKFEPKVFPPLQERYSFIIRPCPHHVNDQMCQENIFYWSIYRDKLIADPEIRKSINDQYDAQNSKIIFQTIGLWQQRIIEKYFKRKDIDCDYYFDIFLPIMFKYLDNIDHEILYVVVSGNTKKEIISKFGHIKLVTKPPLKHTLFMELLLASDIFMTDNLMSSNLGKAVYGNVIPISYWNSVEDNDDAFISSFPLTPFVEEKLQILRDVKLIFPYSTFPVGFNELTDLYKNNPFGDAFIRQELFNHDSNVQLYKALLDGTRLTNQIVTAQNSYIEKSEKLLNAEQILLSI